MSTLGTLNVSPLSFEQANPFLTGLQQGQNIGTNNLNQSLLRQQIQSAATANKFQPQQLQQDVLAKQYANQLAGANAQNANALAAAKLLQAQATPQLTEAQANQANALAKLTGVHAGTALGTQPYDIQRAKVNVYPAESVAGRLQQINDIQKSDPAIAAYLASQGLNIPAAVDPRTQNMSPTGVPFATGSQMADQITQRPLPVTPQQAAANQQNYNNTPASMQQLPANVTPNQNVQATLAPKLGAQGQSSPLLNLLTTGNVYGPQALAQLKAMGNETGKSTVDMWNKSINNSALAAKEANDADYNINQLKSNYDKTNLKGPVMGRVPAVSSEAQEVDKAAAALQLKMASLQGFNRVTNYETQRVGASLPGREMSPQAVQDISSFMKSKNGQIRESQDFFNKAKNMGLDPQTAENIWQKYMDQRPVYNFDTHQVPKYSGSWQDYLKPNAINSIATKGDYINVPKFTSEKDLQNWVNTLPSNTAEYINHARATAAKYKVPLEKVLQDQGMQ